MPATEFYEPLFVDGNGQVCPAGPFNISEKSRDEALAVQVHFLILQGEVVATGSNGNEKGATTWFGKSMREGDKKFNYNEPAEAYGFAVIIGKGEYTPDGDSKEQYIPVFETIYWSKTVRLQGVDGDVTGKTYADYQAKLKAAAQAQASG